MSPRIFFGWLAAAVLTLAAAVGVTLYEPAVTTVQLVNEPAFPQLRADPNAVAKIIVETGEASFTLVRDEAGGWTAPDKFGYRADPAKVRELVVSLADMQLVEAKTKKPERYARLEVEDVAAEASTSRLLRLEDGEGKVLAEALLGKRSEGFTAGQDAGTYLRRPGEEQAWLASGGLTLQTKLVEWLDAAIIDLAGDDIRRIEIAPAGAESYGALREAAGEDFRLEPLPEGRKLQSGALTRLASGLSKVTLTDVKPRDEFALPDSHTVAKLVTFDGIEVTVQLAKEGEAHWAVFQVRAAAADGASGEPSEATVQKVESINARVEGWAFQLEAYAAGRLQKTLEDLLEKKDGTS